MTEATRYKIVRDKSHADDSRQWIVYRNGVLRARCPSRQSAIDFIAIEKEKESRT